jgi:beta-N-acetylhexosaminidase
MPAWNRAPTSARSCWWLELPAPSPWRRGVPLGFLAIRLCLAVALLPFAIDWRSPLLAGLRPAALVALIAGSLLLIAIDAWMIITTPQSPIRRALGIAVILAAGAAFTATVALEGQFQWVRARVLAADPAQLERLGWHFVVGYRDTAELERLIERRAIGGVFMGARNVEGLSAGAVRGQIQSWQDARRRQGLPPLLIATDQEGGVVSRMSPPLPRQPPISSVADHQADEAARSTAARDYGLAQGRALASLGINLNFAPVVDLNRNVVNPSDRYTRIRERAISGDPVVVTEVARHYCLGLAEAGVQCTLKHFPGLGGVFEDTHLEAGSLRLTRGELERSDWVPFRVLMGSGALGTGTFTMLSHARLAALDAEHPVSFSPAVVSGLLREAWGYDGVLITDDFSMGAAYASKEGIAAASVAALGAGVDLVLIAYDPAQYFAMMDAVLAGAQDGSLRPEALGASLRRLADTVARR